MSAKTDQKETARSGEFLPRFPVALRKPCTLVVAGLVTSLISLAVWSHGNESHDAPASEVVLAPGYEALRFDAPVAGTYDLPVLGTAGDGKVIDSSGDTSNLLTLLKGKISVLSFVYRACNDVNGCPLATYVLHQIREDLEKDPQLAQKVQLLSLSFDPENDTPETMRAYRDSFGNSAVDWRFLTTRSFDDLNPILAAFDQPINREDDSVQINHVLRVYLIDESMAIRNIYSSSLLHADTLVGDVKTIAMDDASEIADASDTTDLSTINTSQTTSTTNRALLPNDGRDGYDNGSYVSNTQSLQRNAQAADLYQHASTQSIGLPALPESDRITADSIALGRKLFYDRRLSINSTFSCAMCHIPQHGFTVNELATAVGVEGRTVKRNAPSLLNAGFLSKLFHDGRESRLEHQAWSPLLAHNEMANPSIGYVLNKVASIDDYAQAFEQLTGHKEPTMETMGKVLADYQRSLVAGNSSFDQWHFAQDTAAVSDSVKRGYELFAGSAGCIACHSIADDYALFTDEKLHNTGIGYARSMSKQDEPHPVTLAPGVVVMVDPAVYADAAETPPNDLGLYEVTQRPEDRWKFRTPSLRNVELTAPYMHNGSLPTLESVIEFYEQGGINNPLLSPMIQPLSLSESDRQALVAFLESLTSQDVSMLIRDGLAAPVGDTQHAGSLQ